MTLENYLLLAELLWIPKLDQIFREFFVQIAFPWTENRKCLQSSVHKVANNIDLLGQQETTVGDATYRGRLYASPKHYHPFSPNFDKDVQAGKKLGVKEQST